MHIYSVDGAYETVNGSRYPDGTRGKPDRSRTCIWLNFDYAPRKGFVSFTFMTLLDSTLIPELRSHGQRTMVRGPWL